MKLGYIIIRSKQKYSLNNELQRGTGFKKSKNCFFGWESDGECFLKLSCSYLIDYLQKGKTITGAYYASLLDKLKAEVAGKWPHLRKKKIVFHQDNAPSHTLAVAMAKIHELRFELLDH